MIHMSDTGHASGGRHPGDSMARLGAEVGSVQEPTSHSESVTLSLPREGGKN